MPIRHLDDVPRTADLVIVGGGIVGAATAFAAARAGLRPIVLERRPAVATLTTTVAAGGFRLQLDDPEELSLISESVDLFLNFADATGQREFDPQLRQRGYLWLTTTDVGAARQRRIVDAQRSWGLADVEILDGEDVRREWPWVSEGVVQARFRQGDGTFEPRQIALGLAAGSGAGVVPSCEVTGIRVAGGRVTGVTTDRGTLTCDSVVVAAGPFSAVVARMAGVDLPLETVVRHKVVVADEPGIPSEAPMTVDEDTGTHWRPAFGGASVLFTDPATSPTAPSDPVPTDPDFAFGVLDPGSPRSTARVAPFWRDVWERGPSWFLQAGQYSLTPDRRPLIGPTDVEGLFVNAGCDGRGVMRSVATGRILADLLTGALRPEDNPYPLDREFVERPHLDAL